MTNSSKEKGKKEKIDKNGKRAVFNPKDLQQCPHLKELAHEFDPWHSPRRFNSRTLRSRLSLIGLRANHLAPGMDSKNNVGCVYAPLSSPLNKMGLSSQVAPECQASKERIDVEDSTATMMLDNHGFIEKSPMMSGDTTPVFVQNEPMGMVTDQGYNYVSTAEQNQVMATTENTQIQVGKETTLQNLQVVIDQDSTTVKGNVLSMLQRQQMETMQDSSIRGMDCISDVPPIYTEQELNEAFDALGNYSNIDDFEPFNCVSGPPLFVPNSTYQGEVLGVNDPFSPTYNQINETSNNNDGDNNKINNTGDDIFVASTNAINIFVDHNSINNNADNSPSLQVPNPKQVPNHPNHPSHGLPINTSSFHDITIEGMIDDNFQWGEMLQGDSLFQEHSLNLEEFDIAFGKSGDFGF